MRRRLKTMYHNKFGSNKASVREHFCLQTAQEDSAVCVVLVVRTHKRKEGTNGAA